MLLGSGWFSYTIMNKPCVNNVLKMLNVVGGVRSITCRVSASKQEATNEYQKERPT